MGAYIGTGAGAKSGPFMIAAAIVTPRPTIATIPMPVATAW